VLPSFYWCIFGLARVVLDLTSVMPGFYGVIGNKKKAASYHPIAGMIIGGQRLC